MDFSTRQGRREQGLRIQQAVENVNLSIEELANRIGCSRALIYQYLSGSTLAQPDRLQLIAKECGVPLTYFYSEESPQADNLTPSSPQITPIISLPETNQRLTESLRLLLELADAQETPTDYRALAATCERILSLAGQLGDKATQAQTQKRLGNARLRLADFPRATEALQRAIAYAQEGNDLTGEAGARQSLGNALLAMGRISEAREQFSLIASGTVFNGRWQGTLSLGCIHEMQGEYAKAMAQFDEAAAILEEGAATSVVDAATVAAAMLYVNTNRRNVYMDGGDFQGARSLAEKSLEEAEAMGNADQHLEARFDLGWCDFYTGKWRSAYRGFKNTLQLARFLGDQGRESITRAWLGTLLASVGDYETAITHGRDALAVALSRGDRRAELYAQLALADSYIASANRESEARYHTNQALAVTVALRYERGEIECRIRLAHLAAQNGDLMDLRDSASRSLTLAERLGARHLEAFAHYWMAETWLRELNPAQARQEAEKALAMAEEMELAEVVWRSHSVLARILGDDVTSVEQHLRSAIAYLERLRSELREADIPDTLLENTESLAVYVHLIDLLKVSGRENMVEPFVEQTGWLPLQASIKN
ncbi:MAG: helix-turn-helix transcriptional regulator [Armatimonadetes bacterium]|nr:helix-turn-helix transcriptional regulator [Armatimonadota bacterium]